MSTKHFRLTILVALALAPLGVSHAADMETYCRLRGGSLVQLPADACATEGGTLVSAELAPAAPAGALAPATAPAVAPAPAALAPAPAIQPTGNLTLDQAEQLVVDILDKAVAPATLSRKPEGIVRAAKFDDCRLLVEEQLHIDFGNMITSRKDFRIDSAIDFRKITRKSFGTMGEVSSRAGDLSGVAVYFEKPKREGGNSISISVLLGIKGKYTKYQSEGDSASLSGPSDYYWIVDGYGYPIDVVNNVTEVYDTDTIRVLYIVSTQDDEARLMGALEKVSTMCRSQ
ncbi:MAG: hypothetical protein AWT59_0311 [Candidatus Gallionella acididurans]|uniref:Uncharacterized protein n=1 Tax=Candidatus Gallionella acididurans TaxID=1796491 RepID=A0A139BXA1_9PROT|nr:MAG: hypothetical protein AWT59_0311 [Candidatus Gallionella acididurans]